MSQSRLSQILLIASFSQIWATVGNAESIADAVGQAYLHSPILERQRYIQKSVDETYVQARAGYGPQVAVTATDTRSRVIGASALEAPSNRQVVLDIGQPLYTSGRIRGQVLAAHSNVDAGLEDLRTTEQSLVMNVVTAYSRVLRDREMIQVGQQNVEVLRQQLNENRQRYLRAGDVTLTDVGQSDSRLAGAELQVANLLSQLKSSEDHYITVVGLRAHRLDPLPTLQDLPSSLEAAIRIALKQNPQLRAAQYAERSSYALAASARGGLGPNVSFDLQAEHERGLDGLNNRLSYGQVTANLTITQPIFASGVLRSKVRQADAQNRADQAETSERRREVIENVESAWNALYAARAALIYGSRQVSSAQLAYAGMHTEQLNGLRSTIDTLNAEQELVAAQLDLLQSRSQEYTAEVGLLLAMGTLNASIFNRDIGQIDSESYFQSIKTAGGTPFAKLAERLDRLGSKPAPTPILASGSVVSEPFDAPGAPLLPQPTAHDREEPLTPIGGSKLVPADPDGGLPAVLSAPIASISHVGRF